MRHLVPEAAEVLDLPDEARIEFIRASAWIPEAAREAAIARLEDLLVYPNCVRMPNLVITAESNSGKTTLARRFASRHPFVEYDDGIHAPVVMIEAPSQADEKRIYAAVVAELYGRPSGWARTSQLEYQAITLLRHTGTKLLIIDEFHHFDTGRFDAKKACRNAIKSLSNKASLSIIAIGLPESLKVIQVDPQLHNRFDRLALERMGPSKELLSLLMTFETILPLRKPSLLTDPAMVAAIMVRTQGLFGEICKLLKLAAEYAVRSESECINLSTFDKCSYVSPSD